MFLPGARPPGEEAELATRSSRMLERIKVYISNYCDDKGNQKAKVLSKEENEGMKEIIKKVKDEEVVVPKPTKATD